MGTQAGRAAAGRNNFGTGWVKRIYTGLESAPQSIAFPALSEDACELLTALSSHNRALTSYKLYHELS